MEPTLAEEIRALLDVHEKASAETYPLALILADAHLAKAFPALAAKMLTVIAEMDSQRDESLLQDGAIERQNRRIRYRDARIAVLEKELAHLRWEAECLQVEAK